MEPDPTPHPAPADLAGLPDADGGRAAGSLRTPAPPGMNGPPGAAAPSPLPTVVLQGERLVQPQYAGFGLSNLAPTVLRLLGGPTAELPLPPLDPAVLPERLTRAVRAVVVLLVDGLGYHQLLREVEAGAAPALASLLGGASEGASDRAFATLTSVFPTTTVAALGSLSTAVAPAQHGLLGYTLHLEEFGTLAEMIHWGPLAEGGSFADPAVRAADPERFLPAPTTFQRLRAAGVEHVWAVSPASFRDSALSRMLHQGSTYAGYVAPSSVSAVVPRLLRAHAGPTYVYAYWPTVDTVAHALGPCSEEHGAEVAALDRAVERLLDALPGRGDTLLLLTADHGHVETSEDQLVRLNDYAGLEALLAAPPSGDRRAVYLHARPGQAAALEAVARQELGHAAVVLGRAEAERRRLFGPQPLPAWAAARVGDVLLLARGSLQLADDLPALRTPAPLFRGLHGGLSADEALVPLLALRV